MANPLMTPMVNLLAKIKEAVCKRTDVKLAEIKGSLESLSVRFDEIAVVEAAKRKRLEDDVFSIPIADKSYLTDGIEAHRRRMMLVGQYKTMIDKCLGTISVAKDQIAFEKKLQDANFDSATMSTLDRHDTCMASGGGKKKKNGAMGILDRIKNALGVDNRHGRNATAIPSLEELHDRIITTELGVKEHLGKVVELETSKKVLFDEALAGASAEARSELLIRQKELDWGIKRETAMVKMAAKQLDFWLDAELFMRIRESFSRSGFERLVGAKDGDSEGVQNAFDELLAHAECFATLKEPSVASASEAQAMPAAPDED